MGDGGVACVPSQHVMERFPVSDTYCRGNGGGGYNSKSKSKSLQFSELQHQQKHENREEAEDGEFGTDRELAVKESMEELESGEVEEGELHPIELLENGEFEYAPAKLRSEIEKGEFVPEKWEEEEIEKGEFIPEKRRRGWRGEVERVEYADKWRKGGDEFEKGQFNPKDKWRKGDVAKDDFGSAKGRKWDDGRKWEERMPPMKISDEDEWNNRSSRWDPNNGRDSKSSSKYPNYESQRGGVKEYYNSGNWSKRHANEVESNNRRYPDDFSDRQNSKSRKVSDSFSRSGYPEKNYSHISEERSYKNSSSSSSSRYNASKHYDSSLPSRDSRSTYDKNGRSPPGYNTERTPHDRAPRYHDHHRARSPERSPHDRSRHYDHRNHRSPPRVPSPRDRARYHDRRERTPGFSGRSPSPRDRARHHDRRDQTPGYAERSPLDRSQIHIHQEASQKRDESEKSEEKLGWKDSHKLSGIVGSVEKNVNDQISKKEQLQHAILNCTEPPPTTQVNGAQEELQSMEEDMDISETPPHEPVMADPNSGSWFYLDYLGTKQGPSRLCDLKNLVEVGLLQSDHLIKHSQSDMWLTVENAVSPLAPLKFSSVVSDTVTQMASPPEAPGNLLGDVGQSANNHLDQESSVSLDGSSAALEPSEDLHIGERVAALLKGYDVSPGMELETLGVVLQTTFWRTEWDTRGNFQGFTSSRSDIRESYGHQKDEELNSEKASQTRSIAFYNKDYTFSGGDSSDWFSSGWSCKGGDWKRKDEVSHDKTYKKKLVFNDGYPLCRMPKSGCEDPRWHRKDELYYPSRSRKLSLPNWAFNVSEERNDSSGTSKASQVRGARGSVLPVIRINACVVNNHVPSVSESRTTSRGYERYSSRSVRSLLASSDGKSSKEESVSQSKESNEQESQGLQKCIITIDIPKDRICMANELHLHLGEWYYLDGAGHEHGPSTFRELQSLAQNGTIQKYTSVFRKLDKIWVPITCTDQEQKLNPVADTSVAHLSQLEAIMHDQELKVKLDPDSSVPHLAQPEVVLHEHDSEDQEELVASSSAALLIQSDVIMHDQEQNVEVVANSSVPLLIQSEVAMNKSIDTGSSSFHSLYPQFIGYTRGKLHELVMKSYKSREFAAAINEVLDPWINLKQPKKDLEKHTLSSSVIRSSLKSENGHIRAAKRSRVWVDDNEEEYNVKDDNFEELCGDSTFKEENCGSCTAEAEMENWGLLNGQILARVFHFLRSDMKSLAFSAASCKHWNSAVNSYRGISRLVDFSDAGLNCTDFMFRKIMSGYKKTKITTIMLRGCTNLSSNTVQEILNMFPCLSSIDIRGCNQLKELSHSFQNVNWIMSTSREIKTCDGSNSKIRCLKHINEKSHSISESAKGWNSYLDESNEPGVRRDSSSKLFGQNLYKRSKLLDARKRSNLLSRDVHMKRWLYRKSDTGYKRVEEFLDFSLKDIMKENNFDFFVPKVAEIESRMKNGYYLGHGLSSVKEDISRMCRDAIKAKNRGDAGDMNHMIMLFIRLVKSLEQNSKSSSGRGEMVKMLKEGLPATASKFKKKDNKMMSEKKCLSRGVGTTYVNGSTENGEYASDREIRRRLSKLNKRSLDSESETSDDNLDGGGSTNSDTESDLELRGIQDSRGDEFVTEDEVFDCTNEEREWGARMTKASLVPPVTRKYEVIDQYVIIADEKEVERKMRVSLPEDYDEKLLAQKNGNEDMEIPEVKDYKPRKQLGEEVLEQEVYGIDPYTHNLLLDSMPDEVDWPLSDKHMFIEDVLLRTLNTQVRHFTGSGNAPMTYLLQPVVEEIQKTAEENNDKLGIKMCYSILKAMRNRPEDNYVAYRKGLGVVCNKEEGFGEDDFVVEFLGEVYPVWKWFEKQDGIRSLQKNDSDTATEFYNIYLERPKGDRDGYDLVVVDAMHKANFASRICHSCRPNCEAKVTAVDGVYQIGVHTVRPIGYGEEITFDYNSVTESKEEYEASVCLCGSQVCRGSYLNLTGEGAYQKVLKERHGMLDRYQLMLEACQLNCTSEEDYIDLGRAGLGTCLLAGLPDWLISYSARLVRFINFERTKLPEEILRFNLAEKSKFFSDISVDVEKSDAEVQAEGVYNQRLQNLAVTLDKVRYVMRSVFGDPKKAPPPLEKLTPEEVVSFLWKGEGSLVEDLLHCVAPHMDKDSLNDFKSKIQAHNPSGSDDLLRELRKSLLWLRDEVRNLQCSYKCRHDAAADLIHIYAYTKCFFRVREYKVVTSPPVYISPLDMGAKYSHKLGSGLTEYRKTYGENYCLGQLINWHSQTSAEPDSTLATARRGCLSLPEIASFYAMAHKPSQKCIYGPETVKFMLSRMEKQPQRPWPSEKIWSFKSVSQVIGSPMLDAVLNKKTSLDKELLHWLKNRLPIFQATWDR
ncbi:hypothetical protein GIB67_039926 [Kingdonia uniflora]|uniref:SET domain-containing protein n=1 Tax=Kingdonia uniflora TaxID=39325 RepID=A0A7J7P3G7_9MAGN|nr:hypothetical protein GIB67_039926 [Kingdonia uniflora]